MFGPVDPWAISVYGRYVPPGSRRKSPWARKRSENDVLQGGLYKTNFLAPGSFKIQIRGQIRNQRESLYILMGSALGWLLWVPVGAGFPAWRPAS